MLGMKTSIISEAELACYQDQLHAAPSEVSIPLRGQMVGEGGDGWEGGTASVCGRAIWALRLRETWSVPAAQLAATTPV